MSVCERGGLGAGLGSCDVWQEVQPMPLRQCSLRRKLLWSSRPEWQLRQVSEMSLAVSNCSLSVRMARWPLGVVSPPDISSTCARPGPWQASQPTTLPFQLGSRSSVACGVLVKLACCASWQPAQVSVPTKSAGSAFFPCAVFGASWSAAAEPRNQSAPVNSTSAETSHAQTSASLMTLNRFIRVAAGKGPGGWANGSRNEVSADAPTVYCLM